MEIFNFIFTICSFPSMNPSTPLRMESKNLDFLKTIEIFFSDAGLRFQRGLY